MIKLSEFQFRFFGSYVRRNITTKIIYVLSGKKIFCVFVILMSDLDIMWISEINVCKGQMKSFKILKFLSLCLLPVSLEDLQFHTHPPPSPTSNVPNTPLLSCHKQTVQMKTRNITQAIQFFSVSFIYSLDKPEAHFNSQTLKDNSPRTPPTPLHGQSLIIPIKASAADPEHKTNL